MSFDAVITELANKSELQISKVNEDSFVCEFNLENGRSHKTIITDSGSLGSTEIITFSAAVAMGIEELSSDYKLKLLKHNKTAPLGGFYSTTVQGKTTIMISQQIPVDYLSPEGFKLIAYSISKIADVYESEITGKDLL